LTTFNPRLLTPPQQEEEIYPYRRAWRSLAIECGAFLAIAATLFVVVNYLRLSPPELFWLPLALLLAVTPLGLWLIFSWWPERSVPQPRQRLMVVAIVSAILASAVGIPLVSNYLQIDRWLPLSSAVSRIVGYTFTIGIVQEFLKYMVMRYVVWPGCFRIRLDGVAYSAASAIGYATVLNLEFALTNSPPPDVAAMRFFTTLALQLVGSLIVGYGLAELHFDLPSPLLLTITLALAALIIGIATPLNAGLVNAGLGLGVSAPKPLLGLAFSAGVLIGIASILSFLYNNAERQALEARIGQGE
jgi:RsiW-degrading membrane proteinase PrsW (M82 family)